MKEERLRLLRATRTQLEPIFLLHDGDPVELPDREPDLALDGERLWRIDALPEISEQLLIADGHHRYETALAFHAEDGTEASAWMMVVLVSTREEGLTIFPTHRIAQHVGDVDGAAIERPENGLPGVVVYRRGGYRLVEGDGLDVEAVERLHPEGVSYTPRARRGRGGGRPRRRRGRAARAAGADRRRVRARRAAARCCRRRRRTSSRSSPADCSSSRLTDWLALCRAAAEDVRAVLAELPTRAEREPVVAGRGRRRHDRDRRRGRDA